MATLMTDSTAMRSAKAQAALDLIDGGSAAGKVEVRTSTKPATPNDTAGGTLLATITLNDPSFTESGGVLTLSTSPSQPSATPGATGTAGWFRILDSDGNAVHDGDCGTSGGALNFNTLSVESGGTLTLTGGTITY